MRKYFNKLRNIIRNLFKFDKADEDFVIEYDGGGNDNWMKMKPESTDKYRYCNHHHELDDEHELVDFGDGEFVANKQAIPLLKALNELGLKTRSHHIADEPFAWVCILLDNVEISIKDVYERDADRTKYNGKKELLIEWKR